MPKTCLGVELTAIFNPGVSPSAERSSLQVVALVPAREQLARLAEMGFTDARENEEVLAQNGNDVSRAVDELMRRRFFRDKQASK